MNTVKISLIGGIQKFSTSDGPGIRTSILTKGCPLNCRWCHNPELISPAQEIIYRRNLCIRCGYCQSVCPQNLISLRDDGVSIDRTHCTLCMKCTDGCYAGALRPAASPKTLDEIMELIKQDKEFYDHTNGGVTLSGGEILSHPELAAALMDACEQEGIRVAIDTSGYGSYQTLLALAQRAQIILYDIKSIDDTVHQAYTGRSNRLILENLAKLSSNDAIRGKIQIRMPLIHGVNDSDEIILQTADFLDAHDLRDVMLIPYHSLGLAKRRGLGLESTEMEPPSRDRLAQISALFSTRNITAQVIGSAV